MSEADVSFADRQILAHVAVEFGLGAVRACGVLGGTASPKWSIETSRGRLVVRRRPAEFAGRGVTHFDHALLARLAGAGFPVPAPLPRPDGSTALRHEGHVYEVLAWVEGEPFVEGDAQAIAGVGTFLARFHQTLTGDVPPGKEGQLREEHPDRLAPYLADLYLRAGDSRAERQLDVLAEQLQLVRDELDAGLYQSLPHGVIHGDVHPGNFRFRGGEVSAVYDFDYLGVQAQVRDVSDALMFFASKRDTPLEPNRIRSLTQAFVPDLERCGQLLRSYASRRPLAECEWQALPWLVRSRWLQMRLRGCRKVPGEEKVPFVLDRFFDVIGWLDRESKPFFGRLRAALEPPATPVFPRRLSG
jgi:Ser/Thr protein kinase RdoA (MazF antagonist)